MSDFKRILVVDNDLKSVEVLKSYLEKDGYEVYTADTGLNVLEVFDRIKPALVLLDLILPDISAEEVCQALRKKSRVPIIILTTKVVQERIIRVLESGADDYMTKPFRLRHLMLARIAALLRRTAEEAVPLSTAMSFNNNDLIINCNDKEVKKGDVKVNLTPNEYQLLMTLVKFPQKAFTRKELVNLVMGEDFEGKERIIDTHIKNLRKKIETDPANPQYILTVFSVGYKFAGD